MTTTIVSARWRFDGTLAFALGSRKPRPAAVSDQIVAAFAGLALYILAALFILLEPSQAVGGMLFGMATLAKIDRAYETSVTAGVGALTLAGAVAGHQAIAT